jgi:hypothetical protein
MVMGHGGFGLRTRVWEVTLVWENGNDSHLQPAPVNEYLVISLSQGSGSVVKPSRIQHRKTNMIINSMDTGQLISISPFARGFGNTSAAHF